MKEQIISVLEQIRPFLQRDGGDVEFVDYSDDDKIVFVKLQATVKGGIESILREQFPDGVSAVEAIN